MSDMARLLTVIIYIGLMGLIYAQLYDQIHTVIPNTFPEAITEDLATWTMFLWIYDNTCVLIAVGASINLLSGKNIARPIIASTIFFIGIVICLYMWAFNYYPLLHLIPDALSSQPKLTSMPGISVQRYDMGFTIFIIGFCILMIVLGSYPGRGGGSKQQKTKVITKKEVVYRNKPKYSAKSTIYTYNKGNGKTKEFKRTLRPEFEPTMALSKEPR